MADIEVIIFILELIGTVAFSISGAIVAIQKKMDVFGVISLGLTTAMGGGVVRDVVLGNTPPQAFRDPIYAVVALIASLITFLLRVSVIKNDENDEKSTFDKILFVMDTIGLSIFTVVGIEVAYSNTQNRGIMLLIFVGLITGVGGGLMRDMMAGNPPYIFVKHFYACASIIGAIISALLWDKVGNLSAMFIGAAVIMILRILASHYRWKLPRA